MPSLPFRRTSAPGDLVPARERLTAVGSQLAQDGAVAALVGGNLFGRVAMHPALRDVSDKTERGKVLNHAWRRYGTINSLALVALVAGWASGRREDTGPPWAGPRQRTLVLAKDVAVGAVVLSGLASAAGGVGFAQQSSDGAVPMDSGSQPAAETPRRAVRLKHVVNVLGGLNLGAELSLVAVNALLARGRSRRTPGR